MATTDTDEDVAGEAGSKQPLQIDTKIEQTSTCERHVVVTVPQSEVARYREDVFAEVAPKAELPGFRAGKAPRKLVESRFKSQVDERVKNSLVMDSLQQVTDSGEFSAISEPDFDYEAVELPDEGDFRFEFTIEVRPEFETPQWQGLKLERPVCELTDEHVDNHLAKTLKRFMAGEAVDGACEVGDIVTLNATFKRDGEQIAEFEELSAPVRQKLSFGDAIVENFADLIVGKQEGETFTTTVKISDSAADESLREQEVEATFEIHEIRRILVDEIGPSMLEQLGFDDVPELREFVRNELQRQFTYHQQQALRKQIVDEITKDADWELPESLVRRQTNRELKRMALELQRSGFSNDQLQSYLNAARINARESTVHALREHFVLEKIAEDEGLEPSPKDYDDEIELIAEQNNSSPRKVRARLEKSGQMDSIRNQIIERQVIDKVVEASDVTDKEDLSFLTSEPEVSDLDFAIAGDYDDIPEAKHDDSPGKQPGELKLPGAEKDE